MLRLRPAILALLALGGLLLADGAHAQLSADEARALLSRHNDWRMRVGVPPLAWSEPLAATAQKWADQLAAAGRFEHSRDRRYGENLWTGTAGRFAMTAVVDAWGGEQAHYDASTNRCAQGKVCGHFTQLVWRSSARLGCGKARGRNGYDVVVCNYDPPGNFVARSPFAR